LIRGRGSGVRGPLGLGLGLPGRFDPVSIAMR